MDAEIITLKGETFRLSDAGASLLDFVVHSIELETYYNSEQGRSGRQDMGADYRERQIDMPIMLRAVDMLDYPLKRDRLFHMLSGREAFYIRELRKPVARLYNFVKPKQDPSEGDVQDVLVGGKRYLVRAASSFSFDQTITSGVADITMETTESPFGESVARTSLIESNGINVQDGVWSVGMGLTTESGADKYRHTVNQNQTFRIWNASNVAVNPFEHDLDIIITSVSGGSGGVRLVNETNDTEIDFTGSLSSSNTLRYEGPVILRNSLNALGSAEKKFMFLEPGWNTIRLRRASAATVLFDFRFYYK